MNGLRRLAVLGNAQRSNLVRFSKRNFASDERKQGYEALSDLEPKKKLANYAMASGCLVFITGVWYYSIRAVGRGDGELEELEKAAAQKITVHQSGFKAPNAATIQTPIQDGVEIAVAAPAGVAELEEKALIETDAEKNSTKQSGWRRFVFFWRK